MYHFVACIMMCMNIDQLGVPKESMLFATSHCQKLVFHGEVPCAVIIDILSMRSSVRHVRLMRLAYDMSFPQNNKQQKRALPHEPGESTRRWVDGLSAPIVER